MNADKRFELLWTDYLEGDLDELGLAELRTLLASEESLQQRAADAFQTHRLLGFLAQFDRADGFVAATMARLPVEREQFVQRLMNRVQSPVKTVTAMPKEPKFWQWIATGFAVAACIALVFSWFGTTRTEQPIATLILSENAAWARGKILQEGQRLTPGTLKLERGTAAVRFDGGASVLLRKGCEFELESTGRAKLRRGVVLVRASEEAAGFVLHTPAREIVDLGTEFSASVGESGATEVRVLEGEVALQQKMGRQADEEILGAGQAVRFSRADATASPAIEPTSPRFEEAIREALAQSPREPLLAFEGFDYTPGSYAPDELDGGFGWGGPWRLRTLADGGNAYTGTTRTMQINAERHLESPAGKTFRIRPLAALLDMAHDGVTYVSLLFDEPPGAAGEASTQPRVVGTPALGVGLGFRSSRDFNKECVTLRMNHIFRPMIEAGTGQGFPSRVLLTPGQRMLLVAKILSRRDGEDEVSLRIYPAHDQPELVEPATWDVTSRGLKLSAELDLLMLQSSGSAASDIIELRIGPTWRSIVPPKTQPNSE